ncbi:MAG TPA: histidine kinase dimerization/phospho-acceptor domain-containing protein [Pyrinomonadaceae bacterium]|nr:histidine kinase dimerization/phospho-acceptor domain-containing protein [Pyrinomonadaceae bacterium]
MTDLNKHTSRGDDESSKVTTSDSNSIGPGAQIIGSDAKVMDSNVEASDLEAQLDAMAELVARVRHEINNPLTGVLGQAQLLLREDLSDKARKRVETIESLAIRLRDIVGQLRQVQRPTGDTSDKTLS